ncbi:YciI family protein [Paeniglutamicibacter cryotolerans]|uniref:YCII-related domain-containing protein n=1 Tax=Paeniglutamicibacter cryotolerans TaxID=670079 RepID=A0A839QFH4_9MICC|nr:YciI family protein [Paeniglutamicibacter cryotolerans]MBB2994650.1 hypothetical protein [Paeniglutamicibacter cryotolerans]
MAAFAVTYSYIESTLPERDHHRPGHVEFLRALFEDGTLLTSGPFNDDGIPGALLIIQGEDADAVALLMNGDPFHAHGLIAERTVRRWNIIYGG